MLRGGLGNDTLNGGSGNDVLFGGLGDDVFIGGNGVDTASYAEAANAVVVNLAIATAQATGVGNDTLTTIENLIGGAFDDTLTGSTLVNVLDGGAGNDTLWGGAGNDTLTGGVGNDVLLGGAGSDKLTGGDGVDTASYSDATSAVTVNLGLTGAQATGGSGSDTLTTVENLTGSNFNDKLTGSSADNVLDGGLGDDSLVGGAGNDVLHGGVGNDNLNGGDGNDVYSYTALNQDVGAGQADTLVAAVGDRVDFSVDLDKSFLKIGGQSLFALAADTAVGSDFVAGDTNMRFTAGHLQVDLNGDGKFVDTQDFDIGMSGAGSMLFDHDADNFTFGAAPPPPPPPPGDKHIALTFDDGPWTYTQQIVDILNHYNVDATFFEIGEQVAGNEAMLQSMVANGHLIENHSWDHSDLTTLSSAEITSQFKMTSEAILNATGTIPEYYRPPYGEHNATVDTIADHTTVGNNIPAGMQPVIWTVDTEDWKAGATADSIFKFVMDNATDNGVILMHDGGGNRAETVAALDNIIEGLQLAGYQIGTLHDIPVLPIDFDGGTATNHHYDLVA